MIVISKRDRILVAVIAFAGTLVAHALAYSLVAPDPHVHSAVLRDTGHGAWTLITALAVAFAAGLGPGSLFRSCGRALRVRGLLPRLLLVQSFAFLATEAVERLAAGVPLEQMTPAPIVVGVVLQLPIAAALAWLVKLVARVPRLSSRERRGVPRTGDLIYSLPSFYPVVPTGPAGHAISSRGPPRELVYA